MKKQELRAQILQKRDALTDAQRHNYSAEITQSVRTLEEYKKAQKVLLFASFRSEVDTRELTRAALADGKEVFFPKVQCSEDGCKEMEFYRVTSEDDLEKGYQGIPEPKGDWNNRLKRKDAAENILILTPGVVLDKQGYRIGYGGGFYDRFLKKLEEETLGNPNVLICKIAIAYECQIVSPGLIAVESHDVRMDKIVTEQGVYQCI